LCIIILLYIKIPTLDKLLLAVYNIIEVCGKRAEGNNNYEKEKFNNFNMCFGGCGINGCHIDFDIEKGLYR